MPVVDRFVSDPLAIDLGWFLLHVLWQGTLVALTLSAVLALIDERAARLRYALSTFVLASMLAVPLVTAFSSGALIGTTRAATPVANLTAVGAEGGTAAGSATTLTSRAVGELAAWAPWLVPLWLCGVLVLTVRTFAGWSAARTLTRTGLVEVPEQDFRRFLALKRRFGVAREVVFRQSRRAGVPAVIGYLRPVLLLPVSAVSGMTAQQIDAVVAHELAHIRRHDYLVNAFQQLAEILLFFHPAVWWVSSQIRREREHCCDDLAVLVCGDVLTYAKALLTLEEQRGAAPRLALAATHGNLAERVRRLVGRSEMQPGTRTVLVPLLLASVLLSVAVVTAQQRGTATTPAATPASALPRETTPPRATELVTLFDETSDPKMRQAIIDRLSGNLSPEAWNKLVAIAESDQNLDVRKTAISYIAGRPSLEALSTLYDKADSREVKLHILSYIHGLQSNAAMNKVRAIAKSERDTTVRLKAIDYLSRH
jgi:beta-lactamase regulating signal transducer with metallopeptidase domain